MTIKTWADGDPYDLDNMNGNFTFNRNTTAINSKIFCQLIDAGEVSASAVDNIISNTGLTGASSNSSVTWASKLTNFHYFLQYNSNLNKVNDGIVDIVYKNTLGNFIAGRYDLLNETFTQTHSITEAQLPVSTGDSTYTHGPYNEDNIYMLTADDTLVIILTSKWDDDGTVENWGLFADGKAYNSSGALVDTFSARLTTVTSGDDDNRFTMLEWDNNKFPYYTSGNVARGVQMVIAQQDDTDYEDHELYLLKYSYSGSISVTALSLIGVNDDNVDIYAEFLNCDSNLAYIFSDSVEDDGSATDDKNLDHYLWTIDLSSSAFTKVTKYNFSDSSCEYEYSSTDVCGDVIGVESRLYDASNTDEIKAEVFVHGTSVWSVSDTSSNHLDADIRFKLMPEGVEIHTDVEDNYVIISNWWKAYNRLAGTSATIASYSTVVSFDGNNYYLYLFEETDGTRHYVDVTSTTYRVYDNSTGKVSFNDNIADTAVDEMFAYFKPFINTFWSSFRDNITTSIEVSNGTTTTELDANVWDEYDDTITEIDLTVNSTLGPLVGTDNLGYYILYDN